MAIAEPNERYEDLARWIWTLVIVGFFSVQAVIWLVAITLTARDPSFAVAPHYEQESANWDAIVARRQASSELGWTIEFTRGSLNSSQQSVLQIRLTDRAGQAVDGAQIEITLFHCARAAESQQPIVHDLGQGNYFAETQMDRSGLWKLSGVARRGDEEFYFERKQQFDGSGVAQ